MPTVAEDVAFGAAPARADQGRARDARSPRRWRASAWPGHADHPAHLLSGGQKQLLAAGLGAGHRAGRARAATSRPRCSTCATPDGSPACVAELPQQVVLVTHHLDLLDGLRPGARLRRGPAGRDDAPGAGGRALPGADAVREPARRSTCPGPRSLHRAPAGAEAAGAGRGRRRLGLPAARPWQVPAARSPSCCCCTPSPGCRCASCAGASSGRCCGRPGHRRCFHAAWSNGWERAVGRRRRAGRAGAARRPGHADHRTTALVDAVVVGCRPLRRVRRRPGAGRPADRARHPLRPGGRRPGRGASATPSAPAGSTAARAPSPCRCRPVAAARRRAGRGAGRPRRRRLRAHGLVVAGPTRNALQR